MSSRKVKRICFDIGSSYFHDPRDGFLNEPSDARKYFADKTFRFHAATTFNSISRKFKDFTDYKKLFTDLLKADEIITFNGRTCDLMVLEKLIGEQVMKSLWRKPHYDLRGWRGCHRLKDAVSKILPEIADSFVQEESERLAEICNSSDDLCIAKDLANTYRDAKFTFALFEKYLASEDSDYTFRDM